MAGVVGSRGPGARVSGIKSFCCVTAAFWQAFGNLITFTMAQIFHLKVEMYHILSKMLLTVKCTITLSSTTKEKSPKAGSCKKNPEKSQCTRGYDLNVREVRRDPALSKGTGKLACLPLAPREEGKHVATIWTGSQCPFCSPLSPHYQYGLKKLQEKLN